MEGSADSVKHQAVTMPEIRRLSVWMWRGKRAWQMAQTIKKQQSKVTWLDGVGKSKLTFVTLSIGLFYIAEHYILFLIGSEYKAKS